MLIGNIDTLSLLYTMLHSSIRVLTARCDIPGRVTHRRVSGSGARNRHNPLCAVNYMDREGVRMGRTKHGSPPQAVHNMNDRKRRFFTPGVLPMEAWKSSARMWDPPMGKGGGEGVRASTHLGL